MTEELPGYSILFQSNYFSAKCFGLTATSDEPRHTEKTIAPSSVFFFQQQRLEHPASQQYVLQAHWQTRQVPIRAKQHQETEHAEYLPYSPTICTEGRWYLFSQRWRQKELWSSKTTLNGGDCFLGFFLRQFSCRGQKGPQSSWILF